MTIEVALVISIISVVFGIWSGVTNIKRNEKNDTKTDVSSLSDTVSSINSRVSTAESSINQLTNSIALKVDTSTFNSYKSTIDTKITTLEQFKSEIETQLAQKGWKTPTLLNGWVNYGGASATAGYTKDASGVVHLKGVIKGGSTEPISPIMQLDVGYRPSEQLIFLVPSANIDDATGFAPCCIMIRQDGYVTIMMEGAGNAWLSLDGISFYGAQ